MRKKQFMPYEAPACTPQDLWTQGCLCTSNIGDNESFIEDEYDFGGNN